MMKLLLLSLVGLVAVKGSPDMMGMEKIMNDINLYNLRSKCWGEGNTNNYQIGIMKAQEKCMQLAPAYDLVDVLKPQQNPFTTLPGSVSNPFRKLQNLQNLDQLTSLWRSKRAASTGLLNPDQGDFIDFLEDFGDFKEGIASKMGNLTCVLTEMKFLTPDLKINIEEYTKPLSEIEGFNVEESRGKDPEWTKKLAEGYMDCYKISENWPQASLNRNPLTKIFGRHMIFFKCADKNERKMCAKAQMLEWLETIYGSDSEKVPADYGLPEDKYDAAAVSVMVLNNAAGPEEEFVGDFFWGMEH
eukprot:GFUD01014103.1.p1 GENE.GFUD01014103.1~~GFUD01014103.1.p1  ORF type:complete len:301 (-),score=84.85 GFUD01014103.1:87-989(-)